MPGSFEWKVTWAFKHGCTPAGDISGGDSFFFPAKMQAGSQPKVDLERGILAGKRGLGKLFRAADAAHDRPGPQPAGQVPTPVAAKR